jgi:RimJ/RimL family protein N-acetyltransferase
MLGNELLQGKGVYLAPHRLEEAEIIAEWFEDNMEMFRLLTTGTAYPFGAEGIREWLQKAYSGQSEYYPFGIYLSPEAGQTEGVLIGSCQLKDLNWQSRWASVSIQIGESQHWGRGYGAEALRLLLRFGFWELNLHRIELGVMSYNPRAIASYEKVGFVHEGRMREQVRRDGQAFDVLMMSILRPEWEALYAPPLPDA